MLRSVCLHSFAILALSITAVFAADEEGFKPLFDGKSLDGWTQRNGTATYRVEDGMIIGKTNEGSPNSFLCTNKEYSDFELKFEVLVDDELNSGVQIRSKSLAERDNGRVHGPQVEISTDGMAGYIYGEALDTGWLSPDPQAHQHFKNGEWNQYVVKAQGKRIQTWLNGHQIADLTDEKSGMGEGYICLQVHGIPAGAGPYQVRWRNIQVKELQ